MLQSVDCISHYTVNCVSIKAELIVLNQFDFQKKIKAPNNDTLQSFRFFTQDKAKMVQKTMALNPSWQLEKCQMYKDFYNSLFLKSIEDPDFLRKAEKVSAKVIHFENLAEVIVPQ